MNSTFYLYIISYINAIYLGSLLIMIKSALNDLRFMRISIEFSGSFEKSNALRLLAFSLFSDA